MMRNQACNTCGAFIPAKERVSPLCRNENGAPLSEPKIFAIKKNGCPIWSASIPKAD